MRGDERLWFQHVPGAILSLGVASHSTCTNEEPINAPKSAVPETMTEEQAKAVLAANAEGPQAGPDMQLAGVITETAKLLDGSAVATEGGALQAAGVNEVNPAAAGATPGGKKKRKTMMMRRSLLHSAEEDEEEEEDRIGQKLRQRRLLQLDALNPAEAGVGSIQHHDVSLLNYAFTRFFF